MTTTILVGIVGMWAACIWVGVLAELVRRRKEREAANAEQDMEDLKR